MLPWHLLADATTSLTSGDLSWQQVVASGGAGAILVLLGWVGTLLSGKSATGRELVRVLAEKDALDARVQAMEKSWRDDVLPLIFRSTDVLTKAQEQALIDKEHQRELVEALREARRG